MTDQPSVTIEQADIKVDTKANAAVPSSINMPDHAVRQKYWYQVYTRLARPTLDWVTVGGVYYQLIAQPYFQHKFDVVACTLALTWAGAVYGIKTFEKKVGVA